MKKLMLIVCMLLLATPLFADGFTDLLDGLPNVKQGVAYDLVGGDSNLLSLTSVDVVQWGTEGFQDKLSLGAGIISDFNDVTIPAVTLNYKIGGLEELGFKYPLAEIVKPEIGIFTAKNFDGTGHWMVGILASIISIKF